jgi:ABC-2 type transport system permease protein
MRVLSWPVVRCYGLEAKYEVLKQVRMPAYAIPAVTFPVMFYSLFGLAFGGGRTAGGTPVAAYLLATYGAFGVIGAALFGFGAGIAVERGQGWMTLKRASPMPPLAYFVAKLAVCTLFAMVIVTLLSVLAALFGGVHLTPLAWVRLWATLGLGAVPFCALGMALGCFAGPNSAPPLVNQIYLPASFASGLWIPIEVLPKAVQPIAPLLPPYHLGQLALQAVGAGRGGPVWAHAIALLGFALIGLGLALWGLERDEDRTWG